VRLNIDIGQMACGFATSLIALSFGSADAAEFQPEKLRFEYDSSKLAPKVERIGLTDARIGRFWGTHLNRLVFRAKSRELKETES